MVYEQQLYSIREVSEITGVKPVTLRAWQRRYNLVQPKRTEKGHRLFSEEDLTRIQEIQSWLNKGISIGKVAELLDKSQTIEAVSVDNVHPYLDEFEPVLEALTQLKRRRLVQMINSVLKEYPLDIVMERLIFPILDALDKMKSSVRSISKALLQSVLISKLSMIMESENRVSRKGNCLFISLDPAGSLYAWLKASLIVNDGYALTFLDGVEDLAGLNNELLSEPYDRVMIFANKALNDIQLAHIKRISESATGYVEYSDVICRLHLLGESS
ncbi:MerR family transcriptional regulator [Vibrio salinus]|uniref:MerR family transcriptional regulator n=1 Tax=Vibrio salinus TaxID=2899784 RepID=UPI001E4F1DA6|nr:MerR family transcriptional regulator [Vibrio salinus]MCE0495021.1 MerR family transcriptional regulator [Vibrio salinus]